MSLPVSLAPQLVQADQNIPKYGIYVVILTSVHVFDAYKHPQIGALARKMVAGWLGDHQRGLKHSVKGIVDSPQQVWPFETLLHCLCSPVPEDGDENRPME